MAAHRPDPAALRQEDGNRLLLDHRRPVDLARRAGFLDPRPPGVAEALPHRRQLLLQPGALPRRAFDQLGELVALLGEGLALLGDLHLLKAAQLPQAHVEDRLGLAVVQSELGNQHRLRLVLGADDRDHAVEVQKGDQETVEQLEPLVDLADAGPRAVEQHVDLAPPPRPDRRAAQPLDRIVDERLARRFPAP